jgi:hypothetical protein
MVGVPKIRRARYSAPYLGTFSHREKDAPYNLVWTQDQSHLARPDGGLSMDAHLFARYAPS